MKHSILASIILGFLVSNCAMGMENRGDRLSPTNGKIYMVGLKAGVAGAVFMMVGGGLTILDMMEIGSGYGKLLFSVGLGTMTAGTAFMWIALIKHFRERYSLIIKKVN